MLRGIFVEFVAYNYEANSQWMHIICKKMSIHGKVFTFSDTKPPSSFVQNYSHGGEIKPILILILTSRFFAAFQRQNRLVSRVSIAGNCHTWGL